MSKYDWSDIPKEVMWIATDADGLTNGSCKLGQKFLANLIGMTH